MEPKTIYSGDSLDDLTNQLRKNTTAAARSSASARSTASLGLDSTASRESSTSTPPADAAERLALVAAGRHAIATNTRRPTAIRVPVLWSSKDGAFPFSEALGPKPEPPPPPRAERKSFMGPDYSLSGSIGQTTNSKRHPPWTTASAAGGHRRGARLAPPAPPRAHPRRRQGDPRELLAPPARRAPRFLDARVQARAAVAPPVVAIAPPTFALPGQDFDDI